MERIQKSFHLRLLPLISDVLKRHIMAVHICFQYRHAFGSSSMSFEPPKPQRKRSVKHSALARLFISAPFFFRHLPKFVVCAQTSKYTATDQPFAIEEGCIFPMLQGKAAHPFCSAPIVNLYELVHLFSF